MKRRFYAFATKRNHANLPPILTLARRGDVVVWLETETAKKQAWARDCTAMLEQDRGIRCEVKPVAEDDVYAPNRMRDMLAEEVRRHSTDEPFFAITGGQKHSVLGWDRAAQLADIQAPLIYSDLKPAQLRILYPRGEVFETVPLSNCINFNEYLRARGLELRTEDSLNEAEAPMYDIFRRYDAADFQYIKLNSSNKDAFGRWFEGAVAWRARQFLADRAPASSVVMDVRLNAKVRRRNSGDDYAEYDVLLLLANATVLHIECKTGGWREVDTYSRLAKLELIGGDGTALIICRPYFTHPKLSPFLHSVHSHRDKAVKWNTQFLPYTAQGQPEEYRLQPMGRECHVEPFETRLARLLDPYIPRTPAKPAIAGGL